MLGSRELFRPGRWHKVSQVGGILDVSTSPASDTSYVIEWWLSVPSTGQVEYGTTVGLGSTTTLESGYLTYHAQTITGLDVGTLYYFRVKSVTSGGLTLYSDITTFTTPGSTVVTAGPRAAPAQPTGPAVKVIGVDTIAVDDTGATDVTAKLQGILNALNDGDILVFAQGDPDGYVHGVDSPISTYRISAALTLTMPNNVTLWGYGTRIRQYAGGSVNIFTMLRHGMSGLTVAGFDLYGSNSAFSRTTNIYTGQSGEGGMGVSFLRRHSNTVIEDCWIHHVCGDGIYQAGWKSIDWNGMQYITVRYNRIEDCKRQGITNNVGLDWLIAYNVLGNQGGFNIDAEDVKGTDPGQVLPKLSCTIEYNTFEPTTWARSTFGRVVHIVTASGWNDDDGPPNYSQLGPFVFRNNTITGLGIPSVWAGDLANLHWYYRTRRSAAYVGTWSDYDRPQDVSITGNDFAIPVAEQSASVYVVVARAIDGLTITGNDLNSTSIEAPTTGYGYNTDVTISGNT